MRAAITIVVFGVFLAINAGAAGQQLTEDERQDLRQRIGQRYDVVPLTDGIALRPKTRVRDVRLIEITDTIAINGTPVTGTELQQRIGEDARLVLRLSYLDPADLQALFAPPPAPEAPAPPAPPSPPDAEPVEAPRTPARPPAPRRHRSSGDRVRIFGDVVVPENDEVAGQVVAIMGSVRVDGEVGDQVVAVLGSVDLGPRAVVRGDVVSVGGRVRRAEGAVVRGGVTEIALANPGVGVHVAPWWVGDWGGPGPRFGSIPRFLGSVFRLMLFALLGSLVLVIARGAVEGSAQRVSDNPVNATLVGLMGIVLVGPVLFLTAVVLILTVIGIPLLLLLPFVVLALVVIAFVGFTGTAYAVGGWARRRFGGAVASPFVDVILGMVVLLLPLLVARMLGVVGWPISPVAFILLMTALAIEFLAWTMGFGAILTNSLTRWRVNRAARAGTIDRGPGVSASE